MVPFSHVSTRPLSGLPAGCPSPARPWGSPGGWKGKETLHAPHRPPSATGDPRGACHRQSLPVSPGAVHPASVPRLWPAGHCHCSAWSRACGPRQAPAPEGPGCAAFGSDVVPDAKASPPSVCETRGCTQKGDVPQTLWSSSHAPSVATGPAADTAQRAEQRTASPPQTPVPDARGAADVRRGGGGHSWTRGDRGCSCARAAPANSGCGSQHMPGLVGTGGLSRADSRPSGRPSEAAGGPSEVGVGPRPGRWVAFLQPQPCTGPPRKPAGAPGPRPGQCDWVVRAS